MPTKEKVAKEGAGDADPAQDSTVHQGAAVKDAGVKPIGLKATPYEGQAGYTGGAQPDGKQSPGLQATQGGLSPDNSVKEEEKCEEAPPGAALKGPGQPLSGTSIQKTAEEEEEEEEEAESLGLTVQEFRHATLPERARIRRELAAERLAKSNVEKPAIKISEKRESRGAVARDINQEIMEAQFNGPGKEYGFGDGVLEVEANAGGRTFTLKPKTLQEAVDRMYNVCTTPGSPNYGFLIPTLRPPPTAKDMNTGFRAFDIAFESYKAFRQSKYVTEAIGYGTSTGLASGTEAMTPALVIPSQLPGLSREVVLFHPLAQGYKYDVFQTVTASTFSATSQNTDPGVTDPTLAEVDITTAEYAVEHQIAFSAERKGIGPLLDALILGDRLGALYLDDQIVFGTVGSGGIENNASSIGTKFYGNATNSYTSEGSIPAGTNFQAADLAIALSGITTKGYTPDNLVAFLHPKQFNDLLQDTTIQRYLQIGVATGDYRDALLARGVIPDLFGIEIRRSSLVGTGTGSGSPVPKTYHAYVMKKGLSIAMSASRDLMIETFRDIKLNATFVKSHIDYGSQVLHPNSIAILYTTAST